MKLGSGCFYFIYNLRKLCSLNQIYTLSFPFLLYVQFLCYFFFIIIKVLIPEQVRSAFHSSYTASRTAQEGCYQGGDACLEELNKDAKSWLKHTGVPNNSRWLRIFRSLDKLKKASFIFVTVLHLRQTKTMK